jgi:hypothetical protein
MCACACSRDRRCAPLCLPTHPVLSIVIHSTLPKNLHNSQGSKDIYGDIYVWRYIWEYVAVCVEERVSEDPLRLCGVYVATWDCMCGGDCMRGGERNHFSSKPLDKHSPVFFPDHRSSSSGAMI